jgi:hypothetical protein
LGEHEIYEYQISASGNMTYNAPDGAQDDCVISGALACLLLDLDNSRLTLKDLESLYTSTMSEDDSDDRVLKTIWGEEIPITTEW